jgi:hypothetical protein
MNHSLRRMLQVAGIVILGLPAAARAAEAPSTDIVLSHGVAHHVGRHDDRPTVLTFGEHALTLVIKGPIRIFLRRGATTTLTIPYTDLLSASYDEGPLNRYLVIRYRRGPEGDGIKLALEADVAQRVMGTLEARSGVRVAQP